MAKWWFIVIASLPLFAKAQIITTFAGNGTSTFSGEDGPATAAGIPDPGGAMYNKYGVYYFADLGAKRICKIDTNKILKTVAGGGTVAGDGIQATSAKLNLPFDVKLDSTGNIYICDGGDNKIRKVDAITGIISTVAGNGTGGVGVDGVPATASMLYDPQTICFDKFGNLYISEAFSYRIRKVNTTGIISTFAGTGVMGYSGENVPATDAQFDVPEGLVADNTGNIYIADPGALSNRVRKVSTTGTITTIAGNGMSAYIVDRMPATNAQIVPNFLAIDSFNNLYITDRYNERVYKIDTGGILHNVAGNGVPGEDGDGGLATVAELYSPTGIALDACGNLYIGEVGSVSTPDSFNNIRKVTFNPTCDPYPHSFDSATLGEKTIGVNNSINIYPNPAYNVLMVSSLQKMKEVTVSNVVGQVILNKKTNEEEEVLNVSALPAGVYLIRITTGGGEVVRRFVKE